MRGIKATFRSWLTDTDEPALDQPATIDFEQVGGYGDGRSRTLVLTVGQRYKLEELLASFLEDAIR